MTRALVITVLCAIILSVASASRYWDEYGGGNNGVHSNPVFKGKAPVVRWTTDNNTDAFGFIGVLPLDNEEKAVYISNGDGSNPPSIWKYSWDGQLLWTWTDPNPNFIDGTLSVRNGVVYSFNDALSYLTAVEYITNKTVFNNVSIPALGYVGNPVIWNEDNTILYVSSDAVMSAINASTGSIIWETVVSPFGVSSPMTRSNIDKSLIVVSNTSIVTKYSMADGKQVWSYEASSATLGAPSAVSVDSQGNIYGVSFEGVLHKLSSAGAKLWENLDLSPLPFRNSPVLINSDYFFVGDNQVGSIYVVSTNDGKYSVAFDNTKSGPTQNMPINSHMFWNDNILYAIHADVLAAYDTSDVTTLTQLWNVSTGIGYAYQGGLSIGNDGTMFLASAAYDSTYTLMVSIGCPIGQHLAQDGTQCGYCNAGYSYNKDSAKCEKCPAEQFSDDADDTCTPCSIDPNNAQCVKTPVKNSFGTHIVVNYLLCLTMAMGLVLLA